MGPMIDFGRDGDVEHIQTHSSHVFLLGDEVLKIKKPVDFSFLDYSTLEKRQLFCRREVELNRRFSPEVYLGVVALFRGADGRLCRDGEGDPVEYAVRMRRLPARAMMSRRLAAGDIREAEMEALAEGLASFYERAETGPEIARFGSVEQVRENTEENFETTMDFGEELLPDETRKVLMRANANYLAEHGELLAQRASIGRVLDGHGDLKPENIFLTDAGPVVTDCIEFNERFRYGDVLVDIGYLTMGLLAAGREDLRAAFLGRFSQVGEPDMPTHLLRFYETYRAVVKGKIEGYRARQPEVPDAEREEAQGASFFHFELARRIVSGM